MQILSDHTSSPQISTALGIGERAVRKRAQSEGWPVIFRRGLGGSSRVYLTSGLPDSVRAALTGLATDRRPSTVSAQAGAARARTLSAEAAAAEEAKRQAREAGLAAFALLPEAKQAEARARREILNARDAFVASAGLPKKTGTALFIREYRAGAIALPEWIAQALSVRQGGLALSWATMHRWERAFADGGIAALASGYKCTRDTAIAQHMQEFIVGLLSVRPHLGIPMVRMALEARYDGQAIPSESALRRYITRWRDEHKSLILYHTYPDKWRNLHMSAQGSRSEHVTRLNQVWEFDSTPGDVMLTDGRHSLIGVIDVYSRRAKLQVTPTSRSSAIAALTRRSILDWGVPEVALTDNGQDYVSTHLVRVFEDLGVEQVLCDPFHPEQKPHIERFFRTFSHSIVEMLPGYIGHSVADRKQIEDRRSFAQRIMDQGSDPVEVGLSAAEFQSICDRWCNAVYHRSVHHALNKSPMQAAREWTAPVRSIADERTLDILLSPAPDRQGTRVIEKDGIRVQGGLYIAAELAPYIKETAAVLLDATDWGTIYVFRIHSDGSREFLCRAVDPDRTGHDRAEIAARSRAIQDRYFREGSRELKRLSKQAAADQIGMEILAHREKQIASVREFPAASETYSTPALDQAARVVDDIRTSAMGPQPIPISDDESRSAAELIDMHQARRNSRPLPATAHEKYEQIMEDMRMGADVPDASLAWAKRYEVWLETGQWAANN